jgi:hypothetical protein
MYCQVESLPELFTVGCCAEAVEPIFLLLKLLADAAPESQ